MVTLTDIWKLNTEAQFHPYSYQLVHFSMNNGINSVTCRYRTTYWTEGSLLFSVEIQ